MDLCFVFSKRGRTSHPGLVTFGNTKKVCDDEEKYSARRRSFIHVHHTPIQTHMRVIPVSFFLLFRGHVFIVMEFERHIEGISTSLGLRKAQDIVPQ